MRYRFLHEDRQVTNLAIFDCDGVLVDSERIAIKVDVGVLASLGWPLTEQEVVERFVGVSDPHFRREVESHLGRSLPMDWEQHLQQLYRAAFESELRAVEGVVEALDAIDCRTCVASSGTHEKIRLTLGLTGLYERFAGRIFSADDVACGKPAPDLFLHAAAQMGTRPNECVVIEDSVPGVIAAKAAGMRVLAYAGGVTSAQRLQDAGAEVFDHMSQLPMLVKDYGASVSARR